MLGVGSNYKYNESTKENVYICVWGGEGRVMITGIDLRLAHPYIADLNPSFGIKKR
jgi:hypothetical protein